MLKKIYTKHNWQESFAALAHRQVWYMLLLGISAGLPLYLIFSTLSLWLSQAGIEKSAITYFSWAALGYSFKFVWAPLVDSLPIPFLTRRLGLRRSWLLLSQASIMLAIILMALSDPSVEHELTYLAIGAVLLGFSSATQDISIDAYRIEAVDADMQGLMSASYIAGYRIGMMISGAGALYFASYFGASKDDYLYDAWKNTYFIMSIFVLIGVLATFLISEPVRRDKDSEYSSAQYGQLFMVFLVCVGFFIGFYLLTTDIAVLVKHEVTGLIANSVASGLIVGVIRLLLAIWLVFFVAKQALRINLVNRDLLQNSYVAPVKAFFDDYGFKSAALLLALIGLYRISDIVLGVISNVFYQDMGYTLKQIAEASKIFGLAMTIVGGFAGGILAMRVGVMRILFLGAVLVVLTNLLFMLLLHSEPNVNLLYLVVAADNLVAGIASAAFVAFLSSLINIQFTAMQYAIFSSLMTLIPKALAGYSGTIVDTFGYEFFFIFAAVLGVPVLALIYLANRSLAMANHVSEEESQLT